MRFDVSLVMVLAALLGGGLATACGDGSSTGPLNPSPQLVIRSQPAGAVLGAPLTTQPVIEIQDAEGNLAATDHETRVTASISDGGGQLLGNVGLQAVGGLVHFTDLRIAGRTGPRTLRFSVEEQGQASDFGPVTSGVFDLMGGQRMRSCRWAVTVR